MQGWPELQERLPEAFVANRPGSTREHVVVALPSYSLGRTILEHYQPFLGALEHRFLMAILMLPRIPGEQLVVVTCREPHDGLLDYYARLADPADPQAVLERVSVLVVPDGSPRPVAAKLLDRPDLLDRLRDLVGGRVGLIEPWNVTDNEVAVARHIGLPVNGTSPELWHLGFKSEGRRLFVRAGVAVACGREGVSDVAGIAAAVEEIRRERPGLDRIVVKQDNSGYGDGNWVLGTCDPEGRGMTVEELENRCLAEVPDWFLEDLADGGVVEEMLSGWEITSPSAQIEMRGDGDVHLLSTHEQLLGGSGGQTFAGCLFPARAEYAAELAGQALKVGKELAAAGALGRAAIDFVAVDDGSGWSVHALEVNLRKGGTTHPYTALRNLVPGRYDEQTGEWVADQDGRSRCYQARDAFLDPDFVGLVPGDVIAAVADAGLEFDRATGTGVVLHMLGALAVDGRMGYVAIGLDRAQADELGAATEQVVRRLAGRSGA